MNTTDYIKSEAWKAKAAEALKHYGATCMACGEECSGPNVHHRNYERYGGDELLSDLSILCQKCHAVYHRNASSGARNAKSPDYKRRINAKGALARAKIEKLEKEIEEYRGDIRALKQLSEKYRLEATRAAVCGARRRQGRCGFVPTPMTRLLVHCPDVYLSVADAARAIGVSRRRMHQMVREGRVQVFGYYDGKARISFSHLQDLLTGGMHILYARAPVTVERRILELPSPEELFKKEAEAPKERAA